MTRWFDLRSERWGVNDCRPGWRVLHVESRHEVKLWMNTNRASRLTAATVDLMMWPRRSYKKHHQQETKWSARLLIFVICHNHAIQARAPHCPKSYLHGRKVQGPGSRHWSLV